MHQRDAQAFLAGHGTCGSPQPLGRGRIHPILLAVTLCLAFAPTGPVLAQPAPASRLLVFAPSGATNISGVCSFPGAQAFPSGHSLYELDAGSLMLTEIPLSPPTLSYAPFAQSLVCGTTGSFMDSAMDNGAGRMFVYDRTVGGVLYSIDTGTGVISDSPTVAAPITWLEFESSTNRLLAVANLGGLSATLVEVQPTTGQLIPIGAPIQGLAFREDFRGSAVDPTGHRFFIITKTISIPVPPFSNPATLYTLDTLTGAVIHQIPFLAAQSGPLIRLDWEDSTQRLLGWRRLPGGGLREVDPATAALTPIGPTFPFDVQGTWAGSKIEGLDEARGIYYITLPPSLQVAQSGIVGFDTTSGAMLSDTSASIPLPAQVFSFGYSTLEIDTSHVPLRGRIDLAPTNFLTPGTSISVSFEAAAHGGEAYGPFVSCTLGSLPLPGTTLTLPLGMDFCSLVYLSPVGGNFFSLVPGGGYVGLLSPQGKAQGIVTLPPLPPLGINIDLLLNFVTFQPPLQVTGVHGLATVHAAF